MALPAPRLQRRSPRRGFTEEPADHDTRSARLPPFQADASGPAGIQADGQLEALCQPPGWMDGGKGGKTGRLLGPVQGQVEYRQHTVPHADHPGPNERDAPVTRPYPALPADPERSARLQADPAREGRRPVDILDGEDPVDRQDHVVVLG